MLLALPKGCLFLNLSLFPALLLIASVLAAYSNTARCPRNRRSG